jgi:hypothetical protein
VKIYRILEGRTIGEALQVLAELAKLEAVHEYNQLIKEERCKPFSTSSASAA